MKKKFKSLSTIKKKAFKKRGRLDLFCAGEIK